MAINKYTRFRIDKDDRQCIVGHDFSMRLTSALPFVKPGGRFDIYEICVPALFHAVAPDTICKHPVM